MIDEKSHKNILIYNISYKTLISAKILLIRFDEIDGFVTVYDATRYKLLCINYKSYITIELTFLKKLMLIRQVNQKSVIFVTIGICFRWRV